MAEPVTAELVEKLHKEIAALRAHGNALEARIKGLEEHAHGRDLTTPPAKVAPAKGK